MLFKDFAEFLNKVENISGRNEVTVLLAEFLRKLKKDEIKETLYLLQGRLVPKYIDLEFKFSSKLIMSALTNIVESEKQVKEIYSRVGDVGLLAEEILKAISLQPSALSQKSEINNKEKGLPRLENQKEYSYKEKRLQIIDVYSHLKDLALNEGKGSQEYKMQSYLDLILSLDPLSARYVSRIIVGSLRLGMSEKTVLDSLSWAVRGDKSLRKDLDYAFGARSDVGELAEIVLSSTVENIEEKLKHIKIKPGTPLASKLVEREINSQAVWERMPNCFVQPKLDGLRGQIHYQKIENRKQKIDSKDVIKEIEAKVADPEAFVFSRNMENMSGQYPEILNSVKNLGVESIILDSEIIGFNNDTKSYKSYQETMQRRRKYDVEEFSKSIPVRAMCFDILYLNGEDLTQKPIEERLKLLEKIIGNEKESSALQMLETKQMNTEEELEEYFKSKVENGLEGIITKQVGTDYEPGTRNFKWIKLKANTRSDLVDTIDVAILGYYIGRGDRARFGFGAMLAGVYDAKTDKYYSIGKVGSGFKEEEMKPMKDDMDSLKVEEKPENVVVEKSLFPDVWISPTIIAEIDADEITRSPNHTAARGLKAKIEGDDETKGLSIRFPRMKKWKRDKEYPNSVQEIIRMYELRKG